MSNNILINGDLHVSGGSLGEVIYDNPNANIDLNSTYNTFYNKYILTPTLNINCTLPTIGNLLTEVAIGYEIFIVNLSTFNITLIGVSFTLRPNSVVQLIARSVGNWDVISKYTSGTNINAVNGVPSVIASDSAGDLYINKSNGTIYIFDGVTWNQLGSPTINVDTNSISGAGTLVNPYAVFANITTLTSAEANIRDRAVIVNSSGQTETAKGISYESTVSNNIVSYQYNNSVTSYASSTKRTVYVPELDYTIDRVGILPNETITIGTTMGGVDYTIPGVVGLQTTFLICKDNFGNLLWAVRVLNTSGNIEDIYYDTSTNITWCVANYYGDCYVYDYTDLLNPLFTLVYAGVGNSLNSAILCFDANGIYVGNTTAPYEIQGVFSIEMATIRGDNNGSIYIGGMCEAGGTFVFNRYNTPAGSLYNVTPVGLSASGPTGFPYVAKFNAVTRLFEWTTFTNNVDNNSGQASLIDSLFIPNADMDTFDTSSNVVIGTGFYNAGVPKTSGNFINFGNVTLQSGVTTTTNIYLPTQTTPNTLTRLNFALDTTTGIPVWITICSADVPTEVYPWTRGSAVMNENDQMFSGHAYGTSIEPRYILKQKWIAITATSGSNAVTSAGLFRPGMDGMMIYGYGIPAGTRFNYTNASNGTLTNNATFSYASGINPAKVLISDQVNVIPITTTVGLAAVTSAGFFLATMNGQRVTGPNVNDYTTFTFIDANNGTLSTPATNTGTANHYVGNTTNLFNGTTITTPDYAFLGYLLDRYGNFLWAKNLMTSNTRFNGNITVACDRYNNIFFNGGSLAPYGADFTDQTISVGNVINANNAFITKWSPNGTFIYMKQYTPGAIFGYTQVKEDLFLSTIYFISSIIIDGVTFSTIFNSATVRVFFKENDRKNIGVAIENLGLVPTKIATSGIITTSIVLTPNRIYYINQNNGSLTLSNIYGLQPIGFSISSTQLVLFK